MVRDAQEHVCSGCHGIIATHDPEAYQRGTFYYHSGAHEQMHVVRNRNGFLGANGNQARGLNLEKRAGS